MSETDLAAAVLAAIAKTERIARALNARHPSPDRQVALDRCRAATTAGARPARPGAGPSSDMLKFGVLLAGRRRLIQETAPGVE